MTPVLVFRLKPAGRAGLMLYVSVPVKLLAEIALVAVRAELTWPLTVWLLGDRLCAAKLRLKLALATSVPLTPVMVYAVAACATVGVPDTTPVLVSKLKPAGKAGLML